MRSIVLACCLAALIIPAAAQAQSGCEARAQDRRVAGTVLGAVGGAIIGNQVSHNGGAIVGGVGGAIVGNQLSRTKCYHRRRYADAAAPVSQGRCGLEDQSFYDARGALVHRQVQVCH